MVVMDSIILLLCTKLLLSLVGSHLSPFKSPLAPLAGLVQQWTWRWVQQVLSALHVCLNTISWINNDSWNFYVQVVDSYLNLLFGLLPDLVDDVSIHIHTSSPTVSPHSPQNSANVQQHPPPAHVNTSIHIYKHFHLPWKVWLLKIISEVIGFKGKDSS